MVTHDDVIAIARLSKLYIPEEELDSMTKAMDDIIKFADTINNADEVVESYDRDEILCNANDIDEGHFLVRKRV